MRQLWVCLAAIGFLGCDDFDKAVNEPARQTVTAPAGIASAGDVSAVQNATGGGAVAPAANPQPVAAPDANAPVAASAQPTAAVIGKTTKTLVDLAETKKNPKIIEVENNVTGSDPLTVTFNAYVSITSRASILNFKHQMDILKATNDDKYPTFKEAQKLMKQLNIELAATLPPYQMYAYDAKTGGIVVVEDKAEKIRLFKLHNIPLEESDKPFDTP